MEVVYSQCWEDSYLNTKAFSAKPNGTAISITSGGCNSLALLLDGAERVVSFDFNPAQNLYLKLKVAAIKLFDYGDFCDFLGAEFIHEKANPEKRLPLFEKLKSNLDSETRDFFENQHTLIKEGLINCGKIEQYFKVYGQVLLRLYPNFAFQRFFTVKNLHKQRKMYETTIDKQRWRYLNVLFLNKWALGFAKGFHSFEHVEDVNLEGGIYKKVRHLCLRQLLSNTAFLPQIITQKYPNREAVPEYLKEINFNQLKTLINKLEIKQGTLIDILKQEPDNSITNYNVSNIFEWMSQEIFEDQLDWIHKKGTSNSVMAYRYTFAKKKPLRDKYLEMFDDRVEDAAELHDIDKSFMYSHFIIHKINK